MKIILIAGEIYFFVSFRRRARFLERKVEKRTKALRESEEKYRTLFEHTGTAMWITEEDTTISLVNEDLEALSGYSRAELEGKKSWTEFIAHDDLQSVKRNHELRMKGEKAPTSYEFKFVDRKRAIKNIYITVGLIPGTKRSISSLIDITELKHMEEKLIRSERLATIGKLSASIAHELRQPLGVINNANYLLKMSLTEADETTYEQLNIIDEAVKSAGDNITGLLELTRTRAPTRQGVEVSSVIDNALEKFDIAENIALKKDIPDDIPAIFVDPVQIGLVFYNIINNAIQAMSEVKAGELAIKAWLSEKEATRMIKVSFCDTGVGITKENMKNVFEPLFTTKARGIGLGLVICKNLVEANNGKIEVRSEEGKGTTVTVILPVVENHNILED